MEPLGLVLIQILEKQIQDLILVLEIRPGSGFFFLLNLICNRQLNCQLTSDSKPFFPAPKFQVLIRVSDPEPDPALEPNSGSSLVLKYQELTKLSNHPTLV